MAAGSCLFSLVAPDSLWGVLSASAATYLFTSAGTNSGRCTFGAFFLAYDDELPYLVEWPPDLLDITDMDDEHVLYHLRNQLVRNAIIGTSVDPAVEINAADNKRSDD